ncbi:MAG: ParB N-terminal domain-containing protein [Verrucomicrobiota bacterium]
MSETIEIHRVAPASLEPDPNNPRRRFEQKELVGLADSIRDIGIKQPLLCVGNRIVFGERRWRAAMMVARGYETVDGEKVEGDESFLIPCYREELSDLEIFQMQLAENLQRESMTPLEEGRAYARMRDEFDLSLNAIAKLLGLQRNQVRRRLVLLNAPEPVQAQLDAREIPLYAVEQALRVPDDDLFSEALQVALDSGSGDRATAQIDKRYVRPAREKELWENPGEMLEEWNREYEEWAQQMGISEPIGFPERLPYHTCREIFPAGITQLHTFHAPDYRLADQVPEGTEDGLIPGARTEETWAVLADRYGGPLYSVCDGEMNFRIVIRVDLVADAARLALRDSIEDCIFAATSRADQEKQNAEAKRRAEEEKEKQETLETDLREMLLAVEDAVEKSPDGLLSDPDRFTAFLESVKAMVAISYFGLDGGDHPTAVAAEIMGKPESEENQQELSVWGDVKDAGTLEVLLHCSYLVWCFGQLEGELEHLPLWVKLRKVYQI